MTEGGKPRPGEWVFFRPSYYGVPVDCFHIGLTMRDAILFPCRMVIPIADAMQHGQQSLLKSEPAKVLVCCRCASDIAAFARRKGVKPPKEKKNAQVADGEADIYRQPGRLT